MNTDIKHRKLGLIGTILGLIALGIAFFQFFLGPIEKPPEIEEVIAEKTIKIKEAISAKIKGQEYKSTNEEVRFGPDKIVELSVIILGFVAIVFGVMGFIQKEQLRPSCSAIALGVGAVTFQVAVVIAAAIIFVFILAIFLGSLGFS